MRGPPGQEILIREMLLDDVTPLRDLTARLGIFERYYEECTQGERCGIVALVGREYAGYVTVIWQSRYPPFRTKGIPEISDLNVLPDYRRRGIGTALMDTAEAKILERTTTAGLGVGLYDGYGPAQRMYVARGYVPDGNCLYSHYEPVKPWSHVKVDDDLCIYLTKDLS